MYMINTSVSVDEFRSNLATILGRVMYGKDKIIIKKYNREAAILLSLDEYEKITDPTKRFSNKEWEDKFAIIDKIKKRIPDAEQKALQQDIDETIKEVRAEKRNGL